VPGLSVRPTPASPPSRTRESPVQDSRVSRPRPASPPFTTRESAVSNLRVCRSRPASLPLATCESAVQDLRVSRSGPASHRSGPREPPRARLVSPVTTRECLGHDLRVPRSRLPISRSKPASPLFNPRVCCSRLASPSIQNPRVSRSELRWAVRATAHGVHHGAALQRAPASGNSIAGRWPPAPGHHATAWHRHEQPHCGQPVDNRPSCGQLPCSAAANQRRCHPSPVGWKSGAGGQTPSSNPQTAKEPGAAPDAAHRLLALREPSPDGPRSPPSEPLGPDPCLPEGACSVERFTAEDRYRLRQETCHVLRTDWTTRPLCGFHRSLLNRDNPKSIGTCVPILAYWYVCPTPPASPTSALH
jgi:hypothetical protein